jgi:hypothetical protein
MNTLRKKNSLLFDLTLFLVFTIASFGSYVLAREAGATGATVALAILAMTCLIMVISR